MSVKIGKARFGGNNFQQRKYFKLKDGEQAYRILPPLGELADSGRWSMFYSVHYGYKTTDGKQKPFLSPEVKNKGAVEVSDAAKERIISLKAKLEEAVKSNNKAAVEKLETLVGYPDGMYNQDNNHYLNVVDAQGNIGILKLRHKAKLALEAEIAKLNAKGVDPLSVEDGRYFVFTRTGKNRDTAVKVDVLKEKFQLDEATSKSLGVPAGTQVERELIHKLDDSILNRLATEAGELDKLFKRVTSEDVKKIVETSDLMTGVSPYMDELFGKGKSQEQYSEPEEESVVTPDTVVSAPTPAPVAQAPKSAPATAKVAPAKSTAKTVEDMSQEDFLKMLESGQL
jgi:hypothetical protein